MAGTDPIRIAGAGPSGLAAAIALARAGRSVEVHEAKSGVGMRFIGDLQIIEGSSEREPVPDFLDRIGIERNFYFRPATWATFYDRGRVAHRIRSAEPYGYFIRRGPEAGTLDHGLLEQARALGVNVIFNSRLSPEAADIVATGPAAPDGLAREMTWQTGEPERIDVFFDHRLSPGGYSYLFILDGLATFGCAIVADFRRIDDYFEHALAAAQTTHPFSIPSATRTGYSYMNFHLKRAATSGGARWVGEAAGFQDYLFGLGIRYALTSGHLAAESILRGVDYDALWQKELGAKQETSLVNRFLYEAGGNSGLSMFVRRAAKADDFNAYLRAWHQRRWWKSALSPLIRRLWRHDGRCLHKPGEHWCRSRDTEMRVPPLGPVADTGSRFPVLDSRSAERRRNDAYAYCRAIAHKHGANFSVGFRFLPPVKRRAVYAAYAWCRRADDIADEGTGGAEATISRLDEWQRELDACYQGKPSHPITIALADALSHFDIPKDAFVALVEGCRQDTWKARYDTFDELLRYCDLVASSISDISLSIFGYRSPAAIAYGRQLATALQLTNVTRDIGDDLTRGRIYVPREELERFGVSEGDLFARAENDRVRRLVEFQIARAEEYFRAAEPLLGELAWDARFPTLLMGGVYATVLAKLRKDPLIVIRRRLSLSTFQKVLVVGSRVLHPHFV
ncbi:MAG TPA: squalene/phytoene synthase family protein [Thermoanaerobaculia bacterium]|nr:squalene/phytoene synthase family protein [Thermoanaerobaculia bacterium]